MLLVAAVVEERYQSSDHQNRYFDWDKPSGFDSLELGLGCFMR